jgi:hypothetical protein
LAERRKKENEGGVDYDDGADHDVDDDAGGDDDGDDGWLFAGHASVAALAALATATRNP